MTQAGSVATGPVLGIIPARGGSKGIPGKNLRPLAGRPLIDYAACAARASGVVDRLILSTDSAEIARLGHRLGIEVPFLRPADLARDETPMAPVLEHALAELAALDWRPEIVVLLQPTAPLRRPEHVARAVAMLRETACDSVVSVVELPRHHSPDYVMKVEAGRLVPFLAAGARITRRQDAAPAFARDGTVYAFRREVLLRTGGIYGEHCRPLVLDAGESITLDAPEDWGRAEARLTGDPRPRNS